MIKGIIKVWKDPVISKIIASAILSVAVLIYDYLHKQFAVNFFTKEIPAFFGRKVEVWLICAIFILLFGVGLIFKKARLFFEYTYETLEIDRKLFSEVRTEFLTPLMMFPVRTNTFSSCPFESDSLMSILNFTEEAEKADFIFLNPKLEKLKKKLVTEVTKLGEITSSYIFGHGSGYWSIPTEWEFSQPDKMIEAQTKIRFRENALNNAYEKFIHEGRKNLRV